MRPVPVTQTPQYSLKETQMNLSRDVAICGIVSLAAPHVQKFLCYIFSIMLKSLVILAVLTLGLCHFARPQIVGEGGKQKQPTQTKGNQGQTPSIIQVPASPAKQEQDPQPKPYQWRELYAPANVPNWVLAIVAGWAGIMALMTLRAINKQADVMKIQADIQAATMLQWIDIETKGVEGASPIGEPFEIRLKFEAVNNTPYVLTIQKIVTNVSLWALEEEVFTVGVNVRLPPNRSSKSSAYPFYVGCTTIGKEVFEQGTVLTINGEITFKDCREQTQVQWFNGLYACGPKAFRALQPLGSVPDKEHKKYEQKAN
jgi:hypothetical protein